MAADEVVEPEVDTTHVTGAKTVRMQIYLTPDIAERFKPVMRRHGKTASETAATIIHEEILRFEGKNTKENNVQAIADSQRRIETELFARMDRLEQQNRQFRHTLEIVKLFVWALIEKRTITIPASQILAMAVTELLELVPEESTPKIQAILRDITDLAITNEVGHRN